MLGGRATAAGDDAALAALAPRPGQDPWTARPAEDDATLDRVLGPPGPAAAGDVAQAVQDDAALSGVIRPPLPGRRWVGDGDRPLQRWPSPDAITSEDDAALLGLMRRPMPQRAARRPSSAGNGRAGPDRWRPASLGAAARQQLGGLRRAGGVPGAAAAAARAKNLKPWHLRVARGGAQANGGLEQAGASLEQENKVLRNDLLQMHNRLEKLETELLRASGTEARARLGRRPAAPRQASPPPFVGGSVATGGRADSPLPPRWRRPGGSSPSPRGDRKAAPRVPYEVLLIDRDHPPACCLQWLPYYSRIGGSLRLSMLMGTDAGPSPDFLYVVDVVIPEWPTGPFDGEFYPVQRVNHEGPVLAAAHDPARPTVVATGTVAGDVLVFDLQECPFETQWQECTPGARLSGHTTACRSLMWAPTQEGVLLSAGADDCLCLWDLCTGAAPVNVYERVHGPGGTFAAAFQPASSNTIASVGSDGALCIWDSRAPEETPPMLQVEAHVGGALAVAFAPRANSVIATGGRDHQVCIWDLRRPFQAVRTMPGHAEEVCCVHWAPEAPGLLASAGADGRVLLWDPRRTGQGRRAEDRVPRLSPGALAGLERTPDGGLAPELAFAHLVHEVLPEAGRPVCAWAPEGGALASVDIAGSLNIWEPARYTLEEYWLGRSGR